MKLGHPDEHPEKFMPRCPVDLPILPFGRYHLCIKIEYELLHTKQRGHKRAEDLPCAVDLPVQLPAYHMNRETTIVLSRIEVALDYGDRIARKRDLHDGELEPFCSIDEMEQVW